MPVHLYNLRDVPEDEAEDLRRLLRGADIDFYETPGSSWGISAPTLWLKDKSELPRARELIAVYQEQRGAQARADRERLKREGRAKSSLDSFREDPLRFIFYVGVALVILYFSTKPFIDFGR